MSHHWYTLLIGAPALVQAPAPVPVPVLAPALVEVRVEVPSLANTGSTNRWKTCKRYSLRSMSAHSIVLPHTGPMRPHSLHQVEARAVVEVEARAAVEVEAPAE